MYFRTLNEIQYICEISETLTLTLEFASSSALAPPTFVRGKHNKVLSLRCENHCILVAIDSDPMFTVLV
jgi:hypothetical protein